MLEILAVADALCKVSIIDELVAALSMWIPRQVQFQYGKLNYTWVDRHLLGQFEQQKV